MLLNFPFFIFYFLLFIFVLINYYPELTLTNINIDLIILNKYTTNDTQIFRARTTFTTAKCPVS